MDKIKPDRMYLSIKGKRKKNREENDEINSESFSYAESIYNSEHKREILEAFLLTKEKIESIAKVLDVPEDVVTLYSKYFFDVTVFKDKLDIEEYIESYESDYGKNLKLCAMTLGPEFLKFRYGYDESKLDIPSILRSIIESANVLSLAAKINPLNSTTSREARQWMATAIKAIETYTRVSPRMKKDDDAWTIVLTQKDDTISSENSDITTNDLVH